MRYTGSCHCGNIRFEVDGELGSALACNCSICARKGNIRCLEGLDLAAVPVNHFDGRSL